jgi:transposase
LTLATSTPILGHMPSDPIPSSASREELLALIDALQCQVAELTAANDALRAQLDRLSRQGKSQAAPFSKGTRLPNPKKPGRKPGQGPFCSRSAPPADALTMPPVTVPVTQTACPSCGGELAPLHVEVVTVTDLPQPPRPQILAYAVEVGRCLACGRSVRGQHPAVAEDQRGASAHRLGPGVLATAHWLHYGLGVPVRKVPAILARLGGVPLSQGTLTRDALRRAEGRIGQLYEQLRQKVKEAKVIHTDDTGWKVGGERAHLMAFETAHVSVYQIRRQHRNEEVRELIPSDYDGTMITDRGKSYDARELREVKQQKCLAHLQRSLSQAMERQRESEQGFGRQLKELLSEAVALWHAYHEGERADLEAKREALKAAITEHLADRTLADAENQRLLNELGRHHDRGNLLRFLDEPTIPPTNNAAERALRPAVIARKVSQCSKNERGAGAYAAFVSVVRTLAKSGSEGLIEGLTDLFQRARSPATP